MIKVEVVFFMSIFRASSVWSLHCLKELEALELEDGKTRSAPESVIFFWDRLCPVLLSIGLYYKIRHKFRLLQEHKGQDKEADNEAEAGRGIERVGHQEVGSGREEVTEEDRGLDNDLG